MKRGNKKESMSPICWIALGFMELNSMWREALMNILVKFITWSYVASLRTLLEQDQVSKIVEEQKNKYPQRWRFCLISAVEMWWWVIPFAIGFIFYYVVLI